MIGCVRTCLRKQPIIGLYFESETVLKFYNSLGASYWKSLAHREDTEEMSRNATFQQGLLCFLRQL